MTYINGLNSAENRKSVQWVYWGWERSKQMTFSFGIELKYATNIFSCIFIKIIQNLTDILHGGWGNS